MWNGKNIVLNDSKYITNMGFTYFWKKESISLALLLNYLLIHYLKKAWKYFPSLYTARPSFEYYRQVYFVHSGLQDESLQVTNINYRRVL